MKKSVSAFRKTLTALILTVVFIAPAVSHAFEITTQTVEDKNDFVLEPGKVELFLNPGDTATRTVVITSRITKPTKFKVQVEDFIGSRDQRNPVILLGNEKSPYSIKDNIKPEVSN